MTLKRQYTITNPQDMADLTNQVNGVFSRIGQDGVMDAWPIGAIYISASDTDPNETFGFGTWEILNATSFGISNTYYVWKRTA